MQKHIFAKIVVIFVVIVFLIRKRKNAIKEKHDHGIG